MLQETADGDGLLVERVAALDVGRTEVVCCVRPAARDAVDAGERVLTLLGRLVLTDEGYARFGAAARARPAAATGDAAGGR
jgi:hypothetical protein